MNSESAKVGVRVWWVGSVSIGGGEFLLIVRTGVIKDRQGNTALVEDDDGREFRKDRRALRGSAESASLACQNAQVKLDKLRSDTASVTCSKARYASVHEAAAAARCAMKRPRNRPAALRSYFCKSCQSWHLTRKVES